MQAAVQEEFLLVIRLSLVGMAAAAQELKAIIQPQLLVGQTLEAAVAAVQLIQLEALEAQVLLF